MTRSLYIAHLEQQLKGIEKSLRRERKRLEESDLGDKVEALQSLARLEQRQKSLMERLQKAKEAKAESWSDVHAGLREELEGIADTLERFIVG